MDSPVLILSNSDSGLYDFRREVLLRLEEEGYRVLVSVPDTGYVDKIRKLGCEYLPTSFERRGMNPFRDLKLFFFYRRLIRQYRPAAVFTYTIKPNIYGSFACRLAHVPCLVNITGLGTTLEHGGPLQRLILFMYRTALKKASCVFFQNKGNRDFMQEKRVIGGRSRIIPGSGVNLKEHVPEEFPGFDPREESTAGSASAGELPAGKTAFLSIMRLMKDKGIDELLEAAQRIHRKHPDTVFWLLGAYEEETRQQYEAQVDRLQKEGTLVYYGYRDDVPRFLKACQAVVHPSYHEGMSNVLLEAAATARPVLASAVEGCLDTFWDGVSGISFAPRSADSLEQALERFLALSLDERRQMGLAGRAHVEKNFDRNLVVDAYMEELKRALTRK